MTAKEKEVADQKILAAVLDRIGRRTGKEWQQMIDSYEFEIPFQLLPPPARPIREPSPKERAATIKH